MKYRLTLLFILFFLFSQAKVQTVNRMLKLLDSAKEDTAKIEIYAKIIESYSVSNVDSANYYLTIARQFAYKSNSQSHIALLDLTEAALLQSHSELLPARKITLQALEIYYNINDELGLAHTYHMLGVLEGKLGNYPISTSYLLRSLRFNEKLNNKQGIASNYLALGLVNMYVNNIKKAETYLLNSLKISKEINSKTYVDACNNLGSLMGMLENEKKALYYFELALATIDENSNLASKINIIMNIAISYSNLNNSEKAMEFYNEALKLSVKYRIPETQARILYNIGATYEKSNPKLALNYFDQALSITKRINDKMLFVDIYESIYTIKSAIKDFKGAVAAFEMYHLYADSVLNSQNKTEIELLQSNFELEKSKAEINQLELNTQKQNLIRTLAGLSIFAILSILGVVSYTSNKRKKINKQLKESVIVRDKLLSVISHDLKSPINSVLLLLDELGKENLSVLEKSKLLEDLKKQTQLSMVTLDNILKWGQLQIRGVNVQPQDFLLMEIVQRNLDLFDIKAKKKNINFEINFDRNIVISADIDLLDFVVRNLFSNAIKYSHDKSNVVINAKQHSSNAIIFSINDEGMGMSAEILKSLFSVSPIITPGTSNEKGSGLGLLLCKDFVEANGGSIWVESVMNKGTTVNFTCKMSVK